MKIVKANGIHDNLCDSCEYCVSYCEPEHVLFGQGHGNDNVIECDQYSGTEGEYKEESKNEG
jgi:ferredoxin